MSDLELFELWQNHYISLWSDGEIGVSDGVGYVGNIDATKTRELYEALRRHYGDDKRERDLTAMREQRDEARRLYCVEMSRQSKNPTRFTPEWGANELGWDCFREGGGAC